MQRCSSDKFFCSFRNDYKQLYAIYVFSKALPVDRCRHKVKGQPLCMAQYYRLFTSYRVPGKSKDCLTTHSLRPGESDHIIVACKNQVTF